MLIDWPSHLAGDLDEDAEAAATAPLAGKSHDLVELADRPPHPALLPPRPHPDLRPGSRAETAVAALLRLQGAQQRAALGDACCSESTLQGGIAHHVALALQIECDEHQPAQDEQ